MDARKTAIIDLIGAFTEVWPASEYGPAHIVLSDHNLLDHNLEFCRKLINPLLDGTASAKDLETYKYHSYESLVATRALLDILALIPEEQRDIHGETEGDDD